MNFRRLVFFLIAFTASAAGADYEKGMAAVRAQRYADALKEFQADAERGDARSLESLGFMYSTGMGVEKDAKRAALYWRLAAMQGLANAQYMLGLAYGSGNGVPRDDELAKEWLRKSARRGHEPAKKSLAENYPDVSLEPATGPWLEVRKGNGGYVFQGQVEGTRWFFAVPGSDLKQAGDQPIMMVDGILLQLRQISIQDFKAESGPMLDAHRSYEQKYQREKFADATFGDHDMCKSSRMGYRTWMTTFAENKGWQHQVYATFEVGPTAVMLVNSAYTTDEEKQKVARLIGFVCGTFKTDW